MLGKVEGGELLCIRNWPVYILGKEEGQSLKYFRGHPSWRGKGGAGDTQGEHFSGRTMRDSSVSGWELGHWRESEKGSRRRI